MKTFNKTKEQLKLLTTTHIRYINTYALIISSVKYICTEKSVPLLSSCFAGSLDPDHSKVSSYFIFYA